MSLLLQVSAIPHHAADPQSDSQSDWDHREASIFPLLPLGVFVPPEQTATQILSIKKKKRMG